MQLSEEKVLQDICKKEADFGLYDIRIDNIPIYYFVRRFVRERVLRDNGLVVMKSTTRRHYKAILVSVFLSFFHLCKLFISPRKVPTLFFSFPRIDKIGGLYIDKFTDPIIDLCFANNQFLIFEHGLGGKHVKNRSNKSSIIYTEFIDVLSEIVANLFYGRYLKKHRIEFDELCMSLDKAFGIHFSDKEIGRMAYFAIVLSEFLQLLFRHLSVKRVIGPARDYLISAILSAHKNNIRFYELQHGVTYGETVMYSGYRDELFIPDYFLSFGDNKPSDVYGIDEGRIVNIGWALSDYISKLPQNEPYGMNDILVISDPEITNNIFKTVIQLAKDNPLCTFHLRPHPHEVITEHHMDLIKDLKNVRIQDKSINISVTLQGFTHVVGENSTVLYEALAVNKKVGKLFGNGLNPKYLLPEDKESFWEIRSQEDFEKFLKEDVATKKSKCIYSKFNKDLFLKTIELE